MYTTDRFLRLMLTVIALELLWLGWTRHVPQVNAQGGATPVVITGVQLDEWSGAVSPLLVQTVGPVRVEADPPLRVENVPYTPSPFPGD